MAWMSLKQATRGRYPVGPALVGRAGDEQDSEDSQSLFISHTPAQSAVYLQYSSFVHILHITWSSNGWHVERWNARL